MLRTVEVHGAYDSSFQWPEPLLKLPVTEPEPSVPYIVTNIEGLGPVVADFASASYPFWPGGVIQNYNVGMRNIVLTLSYRPDYSEGGTVDGLRNELYRFFPPGFSMDLRFRKSVDNSEVYRIQCYVESHEPDIFARDPTVKISLICPDPYFSSIKSTTLSGMTAMTIDLEGKTGTAPSGFTLTVFPNRTIARINVQNGGADPFIEWYGRLLSGDVYFMITERGKKNIFIANGDTGEPTQALSGLSSQSTLAMTIGPASPYFVVDLNLTGEVPIELSFTKKWVGI